MTSIERQIERNLARCRVILSAAAIATVYIDPEIPLMSRWIHWTSGPFALDAATAYASSPVTLQAKTAPSH